MPPPKQYCVGSPAWSPDTYIADTDLQARSAALLADGKDDLQGAITTAFSLPKNDKYEYLAMVSVTLPEAQHVVSLGGVNGLHAWYQDTSPQETTDSSSSQAPSSQKTTLPPPPPADVEAYTSIFSPATATSKALTALASNAKRYSIRSHVATHLLSKYYLHSSLDLLAIPKLKNPSSAPPNPYLAFLSWSSLNLEWGGPCPLSESVRSSHHVLPILMHHFGCVCPSYEALEILRKLSLAQPKQQKKTKSKKNKIKPQPREIIDMGSGNGYWTFMLRQHFALEPSSAAAATSTPVDSAQSSWRTTWVPDTLITDGAKYLRGRDGCPDSILLLVYPIVGGGPPPTTPEDREEGGWFTKSMLDAYKGDTLVVVGTQNHNGYTGFRGKSMDEYMEKREAKKKEGWVKVAQVPLPSFAGKDEAMFVFMKEERLRKLTIGEEGEEGEDKNNDETQS